jgi:hypothetical protein
MRERRARRHVIPVREVGSGLDSVALYLDAVSRPKIGDHETGSGVDDHGVMAADVGVVENNFVISIAPDSGGSGVQQVIVSSTVKQPGDGGPTVSRATRFEIAESASSCALGGPFGVQGLLA